MKTIYRIGSWAIVLSFLLAGCASSSATSDTAKLAQIQNTVDALQTQIALEPTSTAATADVSLPTFTAVSTQLPTATPFPPTATATSTLWIGNVVDVTIPSGTALLGGQTFVKKWRITNAGTTTWPADYKVVFVSGDRMGVDSAAIGKVVLPGASFTLSLTLTAPTTVGTHTANFLLSTASGVTFGTGKNFDRPFSVSITVAEVFSVTAASMTASPTSYSGACPATVTLTPNFTVNGPGTITYVINTSSGNTDTYSLAFSAAGSQNGAVVSWPITASMTSLDVHIYVDSPNHQSFGAITVPITCTP